MATDDNFRVSGTFNVARLTSSTARTELSGRRRQYILGYVNELEAQAAGLRLVVVASRWLRPTPDIEDRYPVDPGYVLAGAVDQFADVDF